MRTLSMTCPAFLFFLALGLSPGCATYGARHYPVELTTEPDGAEAYLVKYTVWETGEGPDLLEARLRARSDEEIDEAMEGLLQYLSGSRIDFGRTPVVVPDLVAHQHMFIAVKGRVVRAIRFMPRPDHKGDPFLLLAVTPAMAVGP